MAELPASDASASEEADAAAEAPDAADEAIGCRAPQPAQCDPSPNQGEWSPLPLGCAWTGLRGVVRAIWGSSEHDIYAVGDFGMVLHFDGTTWSNVDLRTTDGLRSAWGTSENDVFLAGHGVVYHFDGVSWASHRLAEGGAGPVWGLSSCQVYVSAGSVEEGRHVFRYDGATWTDLGYPFPWSVVGLWGTAEDDIHAVGFESVETPQGFIPIGKLMHFDGETWKLVREDVGYLINAVWGSSSCDIYAAGGDEWEKEAVWHFDGTGWSRTTFPGIDLFGIHGSGPGNVYAVGSSINHFDGTSWSQVGSSTEALLYHEGVWVAPGGVPYIASRGGVSRFEGSLETLYLLDSTVHLKAVWGTSETDVYAVGRSSDGPYVLHYDGTDWEPTTLDGTSTMLTRVWGSSANDIYAFDNLGRVYHFDGLTWAPASYLSGASPPIRAMSGTASDDVFAVGGDGTVHHFDGSAWSKMDAGLGGIDLYDVSAPATGGVVVLGCVDSTLSVAQHDGVSWALLPSPGTGACGQSNLWASSLDSTFANSFGKVRHWNGSSWKHAGMTEMGVDIRDLWAFGDDDIWLVGDNSNYPAVYHYDGESVQPDSGAGLVLQSIWGPSPQILYAVGNDAVVKRTCKEDSRNRTTR